MRRRARSSAEFFAHRALPARFERFLPDLTVLLNCIYWTSGIAAGDQTGVRDLFSGGGSELRVIGDMRRARRRRIR